MGCTLAVARYGERMQGHVALGGRVRLRQYGQGRDEGRMGLGHRR